MKVFRSRIVHRPPDKREVRLLLEKGDLRGAIEKARIIGLTIPQPVIDAVAKAMFKRHAGTLLSYVGVSDIELPFEISTLLRRTFKVEDYDTFLEQAFRLKVKAGFEHEIDLAIEAIMRRDPEEATQWRRQFKG